MAIEFYGTRAAYGCFSNFSQHGIELDGQWWPTTEHYFQAQKFAGTAHVEAIRCVATPKRAAEMGRERSRPLRPDWEAIKDEIMHRAVLKKFQTHEEIRHILLSTGNEEIIEDAPNDYYWGRGKNRTGKNKLGIILMQVREELRS
ncbi:MAG TPA: NADAR family protein [Abditibacteriaceae bacterium]|jgi:ribA/ribD-fused uncharacterized protein|nr:NADAR family protein [Abditibacteriaceae bacterium]